MLSDLNNWIVGAMDRLLGWLLHFSSDVQIVVVALLSAIILTAVRFLTTNQDLLRRCREDKQKQKLRLRSAQSRADKSATKRHRTTLGTIAMKQLRQEFRPLLASLIPIILLATWALSRLEFHALKPGEAAEFSAYFPLSAIGKIAHLTPQDGVTVQNGWIQEIAAVTDQGPAHGIATWRVTAERSTELQLRFDKRTYTHPIRVGDSRYEPPVESHGNQVLATEVKLRPVRLLDVVPGFPALHFPAWLVGYLLIVIPATLALKRALRIY